MRKRMMLVINPNAGKGAWKNGIAEALKILADGGYIVTTFFTTCAGDATILVKENGAGFDTVACIGGDGTLSEVMAGMMNMELRPELAYFPMGTANDVATSLGIPKNNPAGAAEMIIKGTPHPYDVGGYGCEGYYAYIAAFGAFTETSYATPQELKRTLGHLAYVLQGIASIGKIEPVHARVEYDGGIYDGDLIYGSLSNSMSVAGIVKLKENMVCLGDGLSELVLVKNPENLEGLGDLLAGVLDGSLESDRLIIVHTKKARFTFDKPVAWTKDGEDGGLHKELELCNYGNAIKFIF